MRRCSHDDLRGVDVLFNLLVGKHDTAVDVDLVLEVHVLSDDAAVLDASPPPDRALPAYDAS